MKAEKRATIKDVAALAGVSFATVSRTLADRPEISGETKARVRAACAQLGYVPNAAAKGLTGRGTQTLGLVVPDVSNPYFSGLATAIERTAAENGYRVLLSNSLQNQDRERQVMDSLLARQIDGLVVSALSPESRAGHRELLGGVPCVYLGVNHGEDCSYVMPDNAAGSYAAVRYLLDLGHRDLVFLGGRENSLTRALREQGFRKALEEQGLTGRVYAAPADPGNIRRWSYQKAGELLREGPRPHAIVAFSDMAAMKVLEAAEEQGVRVPEDLSLVGYDDIALSALPRIHLTTVSQQAFRQGRLAVERLLEQIRGSRGPTADVLQPELIVRSTCMKREQGGSGK